MILSSISSSNSLEKRLEADGLSADKAKLVVKDLGAAQTASSVAAGLALATIASASVRAALDAKIDADVSSGKLSSSDAEAVKKTLDNMNGQPTGSGNSSQAAMAPTSSSSVHAAAGGNGSGGGGGGSSSKKVLSETITVVGSTKSTAVSTPITRPRPPRPQPRGWTKQSTKRRTRPTL